MIEVKESEFFGPGELKIPIYECRQVYKDNLLKEMYIDAGDCLIDMTFVWKQKESPHDDMPR